MTVLAGSAAVDLHSALRKAILVEPQPVSSVLESVVRDCRVDREEAVAAMWDLVEDEGFVYDASAQIRRHP